MATIPIYGRRIQQDGSAPIARVAGNDPVAEALQGMGRVGMQAAGNIAAIEQRAAEEAKRKAEKEAEDIAAVQVANVLSNGEVFWQQQAAERQQAWKVGDPDLREGIQKDFDQWVEKSASGLSTPNAQRYFKQHAARMRAGLLTNAFTYQRKATFDKLNADSAEAENADEILVAQSWRDPKAVNEIMARRLEPLMARTDLSEADKIKEAGRYKQRMYLARERAFVENDPAGWMRENGLSSRAAAATSSAAPMGIWRALIKQESGGRQTDAQGNPITSSAGAIGIAQVMPGTGPEAAALAGLPWDEKRYKTDAAYNEAIGKAYFEKQLRDFGDVRMALAAYNAGPGALRKAIAEAGPGGDWLSKLPAETRAYVPAILKRAGVTDGPQPADDAPVSLDGISENLRRLDPDKIYQLRNLAESRINQMNAQGRSEGLRLVQDYMAAHKDGKIEQVPLTAEYFDRFGADGARLYSEYSQSRQMGADIASFATKSPEQIAAEIQANEPQPGQGYASADARQNARKAAAQQVLEQRAQDPQAFAMVRGLARTKPLDFNQPQTFAAELTQRAAVATTMRDQYRTPFKLLTNGEAQQLATVLQRFPTAGKIQYLEQMRVGLQNDPAAFRSIMQQIAPDSPVTAVAASILTAGENVVVPGGLFGSDTVLQPRKVAETMLEGEAILNPNSAARKEDGRGGKFPMPKEQDLEDAFRKAVGTAFRGSPGGYSEAYQAFKAYYAGAAAQRGLLSEDKNDDIAREAIAAATGGVIDFNGAGKVLKPWGMSDQEFKDQISVRFADEVARAGFRGTSMDNLRAYGLMGLGGGRYAVVNGNDALRRPNGQAIVIDMNAPKPGVYNDPASPFFIPGGVLPEPGGAR